VTIPATSGYPTVGSSEFYLGGTGGPTAVQVAMNTFSINKYEITNCEFQRNFYDVNGDGDLSDSAYTNSSLVGPGGITAQEAWNRALDLQNSTYNNQNSATRTVTINSNGVSLGTCSSTYDSNEGQSYANIKGPGSSLDSSFSTYWGTSSTPWLDSSSYSNYSNEANTPVIFVSWYEARAYCKFVYGAKGDLPTEAQWERAAKGTTSTAYQYPWGTTSPNSSLANYGTNVGKTTVVGSYPSGKTAWDSGIELYDMAGNVWEWCSSWYGSGSDYPTKYGGDWQTTNPSKVSKVSSTGRVVRGGSWDGIVTDLRGASSGYGGYPVGRHYHVGFRCVLLP